MALCLFWRGLGCSASVFQHDTSDDFSGPQLVDPFLDLAHRLFLHRRGLDLAGARQRHQLMPGRLKLPPISPETTILPPRATAAIAKAIDFSLPAKSTISSKPPSVSRMMRLTISGSA